MESFYNGHEQNSLNGPVKDCLGPSYTDRFKTKHRFIIKMPMLPNLTVLFIAIHKMQLYKETTGVSVFKPSADGL